MFGGAAPGGMDGSPETFLSDTEYRAGRGIPRRQGCLSRCPPVSLFSHFMFPAKHLPAFGQACDHFGKELAIHQGVRSKSSRGD